MICKSPLFRIDVLKQPVLAARSERYPGFMRANGGVIGSGQMFASAGFDLNQLTPLPCGQCISCRLNYSRSWAVRMMLESEYHEHNYFVTLTYDDVFLPQRPCYDLATNTVKYTDLEPKHLSSYIKRLRESVRTEYGVTGIKFFGCGEFGDLMDRPHYHLCLFGMPDLSADLDFLKQNGSVKHYTHDLIGDAWRDPRSGVGIGFHSVSEFTYETGAYTGAYMTKKIKGLPLKLQEVDSEAMAECAGVLRTNPFARMSRRPGLGYEYFQEHSFDILKTDSVPYQKDHKSFLAKSPRYFDRLYDAILPSMLDSNRDLRKTLGNARFAGMSNDQRMRYHFQQGLAAEIKQERKHGTL